MIGHHGRGGGQNTSKRVVLRTILVPLLVAMIKIPRRKVYFGSQFEIAIKHGGGSRVGGGIKQQEVETIGHVASTVKM